MTLDPSENPSQAQVDNSVISIENQINQNDPIFESEKYLQLKANLLSRNDFRLQDDTVLNKPELAQIQESNVANNGQTSTQDPALIDPTGVVEDGSKKRVFATMD